MANEIMLTPEQLRETASELRRYKEAHAEIMCRMTNLVSSVCTVWRGSAQDAFVTKYMGMKSTFTNFEGALENFALLIESTANTMEQTDNSLLNRINSIG